MIPLITQAPYIQRNPPGERHPERYWKQAKVNAEKFGPYLDAEAEKLNKSIKNPPDIWR